MLLTGRHNQTTGHVTNFITTRHDEIGIGDAFARAGYRTAWIGKWHLHVGSYPSHRGSDYVPEGRDRLGFQHWRGYNFHADYFGGSVNLDDWKCEKWEGYETDALNRYAFEFLDGLRADERFCLFVSPHQPHITYGKYVPDEYLGRVSEKLALPGNMCEETNLEWVQTSYSRYLAMTLALDDMVGEMLDHLEQRGLLEDTVFVFTSDHGSQMGAHHPDPWMKCLPYEESILVPMVARWPRGLAAGRRCDALVAPVDVFPSLCGLCGIPVPRSIEGCDLSDAWRGVDGAFEQEAVLTMNFLESAEHALGEWRGVRTKKHSYVRWLDGRTVLYDLEDDPLEKNDLTGDPEARETCRRLESRLQELLARRHDEFLAWNEYQGWLDNQRRVVRNAYGRMRHPESEPDWSLLA